MPNRLASSLSPYLRQHANNPVDWRPWNQQAFEEARRRDVPVFISIGYSSCHWCHVMERETFENEQIAELLNQNFVCIKVDREQHPDVDDAYMTAVHLTGGQGGWPMSVFATPTGEPFFAGTYFPPEDRGAYLGFKSIVRQIASAWRSERDQIASIASNLSAAINQYRTSVPSSERLALDAPSVETAATKVIADLRNTSLSPSSKPKFPPHTAIRLLLWIAEHRSRTDALEVATELLRQMMCGGIHDHVGGGFHRYSTDADWRLPHFEKMLYDNALMLANYAIAAKLTKNPEFQQTATRIAQWMKREMQHENGTFMCALDADSEGEEGMYYTWTFAEIQQVLGVQAATLCERFHVRAEGNFLDEATHRLTGRNILYANNTIPMDLQQELDALQAARSRRIPPMKDDKVLVGWNGLAISGLVHSGDLTAAMRCADCLLSEPAPNDAIGTDELETNLEKVYFVQGLLDLYDATLKNSYLTSAKHMHRQLAAEFRDEVFGGWHFCPKQTVAQFGNPKPALDNPLPSPNSIAIMNSIRLGEFDQAQQDLNALLGWIESAPTATESLQLALCLLLDSGAELSVRTTFEVRFLDESYAEVRPLLPMSWKLSPIGAAEETILVVAPDRARSTGDAVEVRRGDAPNDEVVVRVSICNDQVCLPPSEHRIRIDWTQAQAR